MITPQHFTRTRWDLPEGGIRIGLALVISRERFLSAEDAEEWAGDRVDSPPAVKAFAEMEDEIMAGVYGIGGPDWYAYAQALTDLRNGLSFGTVVQARRRWIDDFAGFKGLEWSEPGRKYVVKQAPVSPHVSPLWGQCPHADCGAVLEWHPSENRNLCPSCKQPWKGPTP